MQKAYTIKQFCFAYNISRSFLHKLWKRGKGPLNYYVGGRRFIAYDAAEEWQKEREQEALNRQ